MNQSTTMAACDGTRDESPRDGYDRVAPNLNIIFTKVSPDHCVATLNVTETMLNGHDVCHGGYIFMLADTVFGRACNSGGRSAMGVHCHIDYLRPVMPGELLTATATLRHEGKSFSLYQVTVCNKAGAEVAHFQGRSQVVG